LKQWSACGDARALVVTCRRKWTGENNVLRRRRVETLFGDRPAKSLSPVGSSSNAPADPRSATAYSMHASISAALRCFGILSIFEEA
jgi:hypothetical protein